MRELIERRLGAPRAPIDPRERLLANVVGDASPALVAAIEASDRRAAVLLALIERAAGMTLLFTERAPHLKHHAGQTSFPGGRIDHPEETAVEAALREAEEEVGLKSRDVEIAGVLDAHITGTGFCVTPVVGFVAGGFVARPDPAEVADVFEVPLAFLLEKHALRANVHARLGSRVKSYELEYEGHRIWGATAAMIAAFRDLIYYGKSI